MKLKLLLSIVALTAINATSFSMNNNMKDLIGANIEIELPQKNINFFEKKKKQKLITKPKHIINKQTNTAIENNTNRRLTLKTIRDNNDQ